MRQILLFEYLHTHPEQYAEAPDSMRREGRAMLLAAATDLAAIADVNVSVALCDFAVIDFPHIANVTVLRANEISEHQFVSSVTAMGPFDDILPIAPESGGVLLRLVEAFRRHGQNVIAAQNRTIALGSDKWRTFELLQQHHVPTIPTARLKAIDSLGFRGGESCVVKPSDGAGGEGIVRCVVEDVMQHGPEQTRSDAQKHSVFPQKGSVQNDPRPSRMALKALLESSSIRSEMIVQPFVSGKSYSIGIIGRGSDRTPLILPLATQSIEWSHGQPVYRGGGIPAKLSATAAAELDSLLQSLLQVVSVDRGYVGIDLLHGDRAGGAKWMVTEINPRLCTSYIGYRRATESNLAEILLGKTVSADPCWKTVTVGFSCDESGIST